LPHARSSYAVGHSLKQLVWHGVLIAAGAILSADRGFYIDLPVAFDQRLFAQKEIRIRWQNVAIVA
jgi:hypothetical protein